MTKQLTLYFIFLLMLSTAAVTAQQNLLPSPTWEVAGVLPPLKGQAKNPGVAGPVAGVHNNVLLVAGGANFPDTMPWLGGKKKYYREGFVFRKDENDSLVPLATFSLPLTLGYAANCATPEGLVIAGGENETGLQSEVWLLQWNKAAHNVVVKKLPSLPFAVTNASLAFHQHKLYLAGGERSGDVSDALLVLNLKDSNAGWKALPSLPKPVSHTVLAVQSNGKNDCLYLLGGRKRNPGGLSELYASVYQFDLVTGHWSEKKPLPYAVSAGTGLATGTRSVLLFGGDTGETFHKTEGLIAAINTETNETEKQRLNEEKTVVQSTHPGFCRQVLLYNAKKDNWKLLECLPFSAPVTTTAVAWGESVYLPSGEVKAGVRTPQILAGKVSAIRQEKQR